MKEFGSIKITRDEREFAKEQNIESEKALAVGMAEKWKEFLASGAEIYYRDILEGANEHHKSRQQIRFIKEWEKQLLPKQTGKICFFFFRFCPQISSNNVYINVSSG